MNTTETNNSTGAVNSAVTNETAQTSTVSPRRGRPIDPNKTRKVYLVQHNNEGVISYTQRTKGAPKPNTTAYFVNVQRNVKSKGFVFNAQTMTVESETLKARNYKVKETPAVTAVIASTPATPETTDNSVSVHDSASGKVTQTATDVIVESAVAA